MNLWYNKNKGFYYYKHYSSMEFTQLAQYGLAGVSIALIIALVVIVKEILKLVQNHINHNTVSNQEMTDAIRQLIEYLKK